MSKREMVVKELRAMADCGQIRAHVAHAAADLLEADAPEEREGYCFCEDGNRWVWGVSLGGHLCEHWPEGCKQDPCPMSDEEGWRPCIDAKPDWYFAACPEWSSAGDEQPDHCCDCKALLGSDGIARR